MKKRFKMTPLTGQKSPLVRPRVVVRMRTEVCLVSDQTGRHEQKTYNRLPITHW